MEAIAIRDFRANGYDVKKGELFRVEEDYVIVNGQDLCHINSPNFQAYFELV